MRIFLASSSEREAETDQLALMIERLGHHPTKWVHPLSFLPGDHTWKSLQGLTQGCDAAIVVFGEDDKAVVRGVEQSVTQIGRASCRERV